MLKMDLEDAAQKYKNTVMMIDGCAKRVEVINSCSHFTVTDLRSGKAEIVEVSEKNLQAPSRIGNVQVGNAVVYVTRAASRMYKAGLTRENLSFKTVNEAAMGHDKHVRPLLKLEHPGLALALENEYLSLSLARRKAKQNKGVYAFDKQFSVDFNDKVWYKDYLVGSVVAGKVVFDDSAVSLQCLLGEQQ